MIFEEIVLEYCYDMQFCSCILKDINFYTNLLYIIHVIL